MHAWIRSFADCSESESDVYILDDNEETDDSRDCEIMLGCEKRTVPNQPLRTYCYIVIYGIRYRVPYYTRIEAIYLPLLLLECGTSRSSE